MEVIEDKTVSQGDPINDIQVQYGAWNKSPLEAFEVRSATPVRKYCEAWLWSDWSKTSSGTPTVVPFDTFYTNDTYMSTTTSEAITIPSDWWYSINACIRFSSNSTSYRAAFLYVNGSLAWANWNFPRTVVQAANGASTTVSVSYDYLATKWDYIQIYIAQESWSTLTLPADDCFLQVTAM